jgi:NADH dehydrogenase (ubiquinone) flavoprotein 2
VVELLDLCKAGKKPEMGKWGSLPMNGQVSCEGPLGKTSLKDGPPKPAPVLTKFEKKVDPATVKEHMRY